METQEPTLSATNEAVVEKLSTGVVKMVWWTFENCNVTPNELRSLMSAASLDPGVVKDINPDSAVAKAVAKFSVREGKNKVREAKIASTTPTEIVVNILHLDQRSNVEVAMEPDETMVWDRIKSCWSTPGTSEHAKKLRNIAKHFATYYDGNAIREQMVMPALRKSMAFTLKKGTYIVPSRSEAPVARVQQALAGIDAFDFCVGTVAVHESLQQGFANAATSELGSELKKLTEKINEWNDLAGRVRSDSVETVLNRFKELRERAGLYAESLSVSLEDLTSDIENMEATALSIIDERNTAPATTRATVKKTLTEARLESLAAMKPAQLATLWVAFCEGDAPEDQAEMINKIAAAMAKRGM